MDFVVLSNDQAIFDPVFSAAIVVSSPGVITGSTPQNSNGVTACVVGDEASVLVPGVTYSVGAMVGGVGSLSILALGPDQQAQKTTSAGRPLILKGTQFRAQLQVIVPAMNPMSGFPDPLPIHFGTGSFQTVNTVYKAS
ncbi:hypothetical protein ACERZ8_09625 [Tateyamaria armeniaca]|uniref:Uncharacterized protein n=1 Tax=Tateyamaria armeniaca TaxID=2518930 RepID=A0ABW8UTN0_9RHOB